MSKKSTRKSKKPTPRYGGLKDDDVKDPLHNKVVMRLGNIGILRKLLTSTATSDRERSACSNVILLRIDSGFRVGTIGSRFANGDGKVHKPDIEIIMPKNWQSVNDEIVATGPHIFGDDVPRKPRPNEIRKNDARLWSFDKYFQNNDVEMYSPNSDDDWIDGNYIDDSDDIDDTDDERSFILSVAETKRKTIIYDDEEELGHCDCIITLKRTKYDYYKINQSPAQELIERYESFRDRHPESTTRQFEFEMYEKAAKIIGEKNGYFFGESDEGLDSIHYIVEVKADIDNPEQLLMKLRDYKKSYYEDSEVDRVMVLARSVDKHTKLAFEDEGFPIRLWSEFDELKDLLPESRETEPDPVREVPEEKGGPKL